MASGGRQLPGPGGGVPVVSAAQMIRFLYLLNYQHVTSINVPRVPLGSWANVVAVDDDVTYFRTVSQAVVATADSSFTSRQITYFDAASRFHSDFGLNELCTFGSCKY